MTQHEESRSQLQQLRTEAVQLRRQIKELTAKLEANQRAIAKVERAIYTPGTGRVANGADPLCVAASDLAPHIREWQAEYDGVYGRGAIQALQQESGVSTKTISSILHGRQRFVTLATADMLLMAIGRHEETYAGGSVNVIPNPMFRPVVDED
jgi:hypothetical protein